MPRLRPSIVFLKHRRSFFALQFGKRHGAIGRKIKSHFFNSLRGLILHRFCVTLTVRSLKQLSKFGDNNG